VLLADTNIWLAAADRRSGRHADCAAIVREHRGQLAAPVPVIAEASWLILDRLGAPAQAAFLRLVTSGQLAPVDLTAADWQRCADLAEQYASLRLDLIDASLIAVAERLNQTTLATLNHRDFAVVRPAHVAAFTLLPG
jgi:predicted nucleic acid-binding protein